MTLYLIANLLYDEAEWTHFLPANLAEVISRLDMVICETEKPARRFLGRFKRASLPLLVLNEHTKDEELSELLRPLGEGKQVGLISDAGLPCIADPGAKLVKLARQAKIKIQVVTGPCSITHALMLSGFSGQRFSFHGYLPRESIERVKALRKLEQKAKAELSTEIFIEAPYRNQELLKDALNALLPATTLAIACDLTAPTEEVHVHSIKEWRSVEIPNIQKRPTIFLIH